MDILISDISFPEAPRWHDGDAWCVDGPLIWRVKPGGPPRIHMVMNCAMVLGLQFNGPYLIAAAVRERQLLRLAPDGAVDVLFDLNLIGEGPINEFVIHPDGSIYVGQMGFDPMRGEKPKAAQLVRITPEGEACLFGPPLLFANGMVVEDSGDLLVAESFAERITRVRKDGSAEIYADLAEIAPHPDGICLDRDGAVWVANMREGGLLRLKHGAVCERIDLPWKLVTSCQLGETMLVTATQEFPSADLHESKTGVLATVKVDSMARDETALFHHRLAARNFPN